MCVIEVLTEMQTFLYHIKRENSYLPEGELKGVLPG